MLRLEAIVYNWMSGITGRVFPGGRTEIFDKFARAAAKEVRVPGVGWGWRFAILIVEVHGGTLTAYNRPQGGACSVTLPQESHLNLMIFHEDM